ncbi:hypothetical protein EJ357_09075 [Streptomyces cyaneochromogenes]|uniref:Uncharacterized protein n=1 Tax=Streptomyces cyaneochromogenes TaxID=2496836 RepID=A0A3Q9EQE8_9ACTN|nr:hypothetical protein EJ357_09075 [Streptomyces cyaneochromogenes]
MFPGSCASRGRSRTRRTSRRTGAGGRTSGAAAAEKSKGKEVTHSLPLSTYSALGGLRQGPPPPAESPA